MERTYSPSLNAGLVRLDVYAKPQKDVWGRLHNGCHEDAVPCGNLGDMLLKLDVLCEKLAFPRAFMDSCAFGKSAPTGTGHPQFELRSPVNAWSLCQHPGTDEASIVSRNAQAVFFIHVLYRQNATMQGEVFRAGTKRKKQCFRSGIELLKFIQGALVGGEIDDREEALQNIRVCG